MKGFSRARARTSLHLHSRLETGLVTQISQVLLSLQYTVDCSIKWHQLAKAIIPSPTPISVQARPIE